MLPVSRCHVCVITITLQLSCHSIYATLSFHAAALVQPLSCSSISGATFTQPHSRLSIHTAAFPLQQLCCSPTLQHFFTALTPLHWRSCSHAAAFVLHLTRNCISVEVFTLLSCCSTCIFAASFKLQLLHATALQVFGAHLPMLSKMPAGRSPSWLAGRGREGVGFFFWRGGVQSGW